MRSAACIVVMLGALLCVAAGGFAQTTDPAAAPASSGAANSRAVAPAGPYEDQPIGRTHGAAPSTGQTHATGTSPDVIGWPRLLTSLAAVLALIFVLKAVLKRLGGGGPARSSKAVQVLSTQTLAPRQQVMLIRIGKRLVLIGNTGTSMNPLCEISDPDEVASLLGQLSTERPGSATRTFGALMGRATAANAREERLVPGDTDVGDDPAPVAVGARTPHSAGGEELAGLLEKVRTLSQQYER